MKKLRNLPVVSIYLKDTRRAVHDCMRPGDKGRSQH